MRTILVLLPKLFAAVVLAAISCGCSGKPGKVRFEESAKKYFDAGEFEQAKLEYMNLLKLDPASTTAMSQLGLIWLKQGAPLRALPHLREAVRLSPGDIPLRNHLLETWISLGGVKEAREEAASILKAAPDNGDALLAMAETARTPAEVASAREQVTKFPDQNSAAVHLATASFCLRDSDRAGADAALTKALAADPKSAKALLQSAGLLLKDNDVAGARAKFKAAAEVAPARSPYGAQYAEFMDQQPSPESKKEARDFLAAILKEAPDYLPALTVSARLALAEKQTDEGMATLEKVFAVDRENLPARLLQAKAWMALGQADKSIEALERILGLYQGQPMLRFQLALAHVQNANPAKAAVLLKDIVKDNPGFGDAILLLAELNLRIGDPEAVIPPVTAMLKHRPAHPLATYLLAGAYQALRKFDDAVSVLNDLINAAPKDPRPRFRLGEILRAAGRNTESRAAFEETLKMSPGNFTLTAQLVDLDLQDKNPEAALARIDEFLLAKPDAARAYVAKGTVHASLKSWNEAEAALLKSIELDSAYLDAYRLLASIYVESGRLPEAVSRLETLLAKKPADPGALMQAALLYDKQGEYAKAAAANEKLLSILPEPVPMILNNQAYLLIEHLDQPDKARELARKARGLRPGTELEADPAVKNEAASIADTLGWILFKRGEYKEALALIREAAGVFKDNPEVQFHLGNAASMMGERVQASEALKIAAAAAEFKGRDEARSKLALLGEPGTPPAPLSIPELEALLKKDPHDLVVQMRLAEALEEHKNYTGAAAACDQVLAQNPHHLQAALKLAGLYAGPLRAPGKALEIAKKARLLAPDDPAAAGVLGAITYQTGDFAGAYELLQESARVLKTDPGVLKNLGWSAYSLGKVPAAREAMEQLLKAAPGTPEAAEASSFLALTAPLDDAAALASADAAAEALLKVDPGHVPALMVKASVQSPKSPTAAVATYEGILKRFPDFAPAQKQLAALYAEDPQNRDKSYTLAVKARESLPDDAGLAQTLAVLSYHRKDYSNAIQLFQESGRAKPLDAQGLFYMGMSRSQTNDKAGSKEALTSAIAAGLPETLAAEAQQVITQLDKK